MPQAANEKAPGLSTGGEVERGLNYENFFVRRAVDMRRRVVFQVLGYLFQFQHLCK